MEYEDPNHLCDRAGAVGISVPGPAVAGAELAGGAMSREAMKLALEALGNSWTEPGNKQYEFEKEAITVLRQALANEALDKKAENARELGLDYEPRRWAVFCQGCRKEWSVSYPHPGKSICADCDDKLAGQPAQQEPVAWMWRCKPYCNWPEWSVSLQRPADSGCDGNKRTEGYEDIPLYNAPQPQRQPQKEPVAWMFTDKEGTEIFEQREDWEGKWTPLYTSPPAQRTWVGLTDEDKHYLNDVLNLQGRFPVIDAIEAKLREKNA